MPGGAESLIALSPRLSFIFFKTCEVQTIRCLHICFSDIAYSFSCFVAPLLLNQQQRIDCSLKQRSDGSIRYLGLSYRIVL